VIDLAPQHKHGLSVACPVLLGAGTVGYGESMPRGLALGAFGAAVVGPVLASSRVGAAPPRLAHADGGAILDARLQSRGLAAALKRHAALWPRLGCPVVVQVADSAPDLLAATVERLSAVPGVAGLELLLPRGAEAEGVRRLVGAAARAAELPLWVKLPPESAVALAPVAVQAGAAGLVVAQPPLGSAPAPDGTPVTGPLFGPGVFAQTLRLVGAVAALGLPAALIAAGGIHTRVHVEQALAAGAQAVQLDSLVWAEPGMAGRLAASFA
jgi:dihydroorotate dehydrogenase (NAD+) catalytic subunit